MARRALGWAGRGDDRLKRVPAVAADIFEDRHLRRIVDAMPRFILFAGAVMAAAMTAER